MIDFSRPQCHSKRCSQQSMNAIWTFCNLSIETIICYFNWLIFRFIFLIVFYLYVSHKQNISKSALTLISIYYCNHIDEFETWKKFKKNSNRKKNKERILKNFQWKKKRFFCRLSLSLCVHHFDFFTSLRLTHVQLLHCATHTNS